MCYPDGVMDKFSEFAALAGHGEEKSILRLTGGFLGEGDVDW